jgi:hypothetical protein
LNPDGFLGQESESRDSAALRAARDQESRLLALAFFPDQEIASMRLRAE